MDVETEKVPDTLAAGIKATGGEGEATPHDDRERANRIPIWVVEEDVGGGLPPERTYSHSSLGPPVGYVVMPAGMHADRHADHIRFGMDPPKPGAYGVLLASLSTRRAVEAAIAGEFGLSWRPGESSAPSQGGGGGVGADSASSLFAQHQKAALDLYDAIYRQAEAVVGAVDGGPLAQVEALANEIRVLRCRLSATVAERDAVIRLCIHTQQDTGQRWSFVGNFGPVPYVSMVSSWNDKDAIAAVRSAAGLEAKP
jgi:hypothetical protein